MKGDGSLHWDSRKWIQIEETRNRRAGKLIMSIPFHIDESESGGSWT